MTGPVAGATALSFTGASAPATSGAGVLTLSGTNTYTGGTTVNAGTLAISADNNLGTAPGSVTATSIQLNGGVIQATNSFTLTANRGILLLANGGGLAASSTKTLTYNGIIDDGAGSAYNLTINNAAQTGTVILGGVNTFSGTTTVNGGKLQLTTLGTLGSPPNT